MHHICNFVTFVCHLLFYFSFYHSNRPLSIIFAISFEKFLLFFEKSASRCCQKHISEKQLRALSSWNITFLTPRRLLKHHFWSLLLAFVALWLVWFAYLPLPCPTRIRIFARDLCNFSLQGRSTGTNVRITFTILLFSRAIWCFLCALNALHPLFFQMFVVFLENLLPALVGEHDFENCIKE